MLQIRVERKYFKKHFHHFPKKQTILPQAYSLNWFCFPTDSISLSNIMTFHFLIKLICDGYNLLSRLKFSNNFSFDLKELEHFQ